MKIFLGAVIVLVLLIQPSLSDTAYGQINVDWKRVKVLVYTKNGQGYVHDNIPAAVSCIQKLGKEYGFSLDTSSNASIMTEEKLKKYTVLVFASTNNDVFDTDTQRLAFRRYIEAGGGFVGIHSVTGTERNWKWFKMMLGGTFAWHAKFQKYDLKVIDPSHPSMQGMPGVWTKEDECYFEKELYPGTKAILAHNITTLNVSDTAERNLILKNAGNYSEFYPAAWTHDFDGGHVWITVLGHDKKDYSDFIYVKHILQGIYYVAGTVKKLNYSKAYASSRDEQLR